MNLMDYPVELPHRYKSSEVNELLPIFEGELSLVTEQGELSGTGKIWFEWQPRCAVVWKVENVEASPALFGTHSGVLRMSGYEDEIVVHISSVSLSSGELANISGIVANGQGRRSAAHAQYLEFYLANFTFFRGSPIRSPDGQKLSAARAILESDGWIINVDEIWAGRQKTRDLVGHYVLSHVGRLERLDGSTFEIEAGRKILDDLYWLFSFCRGSPTPAILPIGFDSEDNEVWSEWGSWNISRYRSQHNWFNDFDSEGLVKLFPSFLSRLSDESWNHAIRLAIYWYLEANSAGSDSTLILSQAAYELVAWTEFVDIQKRFSSSDFESLPGNAGLLLILDCLQLRAEIPESLTALKEVAEKNSWMNGPEVLYGIRNALLHPSSANRQRYEILSARSLFEASQLTLWYLELMLLWILNYRGKYSNRLILEGWKGQEVQVVSWSSEETSQ